MNDKIFKGESNKLYVLVESQVIHFSIYNGMFLSFHTSINRAGSIFIDGQTLGSVPISSILQTVLLQIKNEGFDSSKVVFKALASSEVLASLTDFLKSSQLTLSKSLNIESNKTYDVYFFAKDGRLSLCEKPLESPKNSTLTLESSKAKVLVVDDSKTIRQFLHKIISDDPELEVAAMTEDPTEVEDLIARIQPDVITLDINMPGMDGVTLLKRYIGKYKIPTIMVTALNLEDGNSVLEALHNGALDYIQKPSSGNIKEIAKEITEKIKIARKVNVATMLNRKHPSHQLMALNGFMLNPRSQDIILAIGSSTGGPEALQILFDSFGKNIPPTVVAQHLPPVFSAAFANRLNSIFPFEVKEAQDGDEVKFNRVLIAPGGFQTSVIRLTSGQNVVRITEDTENLPHKPSVDFLFKSIAKNNFSKKTIAILLTGMGKDGAQGMLELKTKGARTLAQDESSCVVYGMPQAAVNLGAVDKICSLDEMVPCINAWFK